MVGEISLQVNFKIRSILKKIFSRNKYKNSKILVAKGMQPKNKIGEKFMKFYC